MFLGVNLYIFSDASRLKAVSLLLLSCVGPLSLLFTYFKLFVRTLFPSLPVFILTTKNCTSAKSKTCEKNLSVSLFRTPQKAEPTASPSSAPTHNLNFSPCPPATITTTQTCPPARFIMPFHADQNCSCMENNLEHISSGAVIYKLFLRP